jgi:hypothetical protein
MDALSSLPQSALKALLGGHRWFIRVFTNHGREQMPFVTDELR